MNSRIICQNLTEEKIEEALSLGEYKKEDLDVFVIKYKMYKGANRIMIEFDEPFDFCQMIFIMVDFFEISRNDSRDVQGFVSTDKSNKITEYLNGERTCIYLSKEMKLALNKNGDKYLDFVDLVTESNKNYSIDIGNLFSYKLEDNKEFEEPSLRSFDHELIKEGEYLYEKGDFENEYLEDVKRK